MTTKEKIYLAIYFIVIVSIILFCLNSCTQINEGTVIEKQYIPQRVYSYMSHSDIMGVSTYSIKTETIPDHYVVTIIKLKPNSRQFQKRYLYVGLEKYEEIKIGQSLKLK
jgi:hypothetical protein